MYFKQRKITKVIEIPLELNNLEEYMCEQQNAVKTTTSGVIYKLYAICYHEGNSLTIGHYTCNFLVYILKWGLLEKKIKIFSLC